MVPVVLEASLQLIATPVLVASAVASAVVVVIPSVVVASAMECNRKNSVVVVVVPMTSLQLTQHEMEQVVPCTPADALAPWVVVAET